MRYAPVTVRVDCIRYTNSRNDPLLTSRFYAEASRLPLVLLISLCSIASACSTPVGVKRLDPRAVHSALTTSILSANTLSNPTQNVLHRRDLFTRFEDAPEAALADLHAEVAADRGGRDDICALAELSFFYAENTGKRPYYLAAVVYAYTFLFPGEGHRPPDPFDPRLRLAADLYNRGITEGFKSQDGATIELRADTFVLPFGTLDVDFDPADLRWGSRRLTDFVPVAELEVSGLSMRYRWPGIGAPLAAGTVPIDSEQGFQDFVQPWAKVPVTALLRIDDPRRQLMAGHIHASLRLHASPGPGSVTIDERTVPLEIESTASLAYTLAEAPVWQQELKGFLQGAGVIDEKSRLAALSPYKPGRMPIVLVHGTGSSAGRWAEMVNEIRNDPRISEHFQFWLFSYNTGNPLLYSAMLLRDSLNTALERLDPEHTDPALRKMVVIGHSQGGLLAKLTAVRSDNHFWNNISQTPLEKLALTQASRDLLYRTTFVHPLPFVRRLVFIATPQRGSYFAGNRLSHWVARFITLPLDLVHGTNDLFLRNKEALTFASMGHIPTAIDNMTPGTRFIRTLASLPVVPGVATHSIIPVEGDGPVEQGNDGIVEYISAHLDDVDSELIVRSGHSCQANPHTINEVRRVLFLHLTAESHTGKEISQKAQEEGAQKQEKLVKPEDLSFGPGLSTPVISQAQKFIIPVPAFDSKGEKLIYPPDHEHAGELIKDWQGNPVGKTGVVFFNAKDQSWQAARGDGSAVIIINEVTEEQGEKIQDKIREFRHNPNDLSLKELKQVLTFAREGLGLGDMYNSTRQFVLEKMTPVISDHGSADNKTGEAFGLMKRDDRDICQAVYVPGTFVFQGPAASPQVFASGGVLVKQGEDIRGVQPEVFQRTYRHADGRPFRNVVDELSVKTP